MKHEPITAISSNSTLFTEYQRFIHDELYDSKNGKQNLCEEGIVTDEQIVETSF